MTVSVFSAAKRLCMKSGWTITNLEVQKMCYLAHMFYMGNNNGVPLVHETFQAWDLGPVQPILYHSVKHFRSVPIGPEPFSLYPDIPENHDGIRFLDQAVTDLPRSRLVAITHWEEGAWYKNYQVGVRGIEIPNADILEEFKKRINVAKQPKQQ